MYGKGKKLWTDGRIFEGDWVDDQEQGIGKILWPDCRLIEDDLVDGENLP